MATASEVSEIIKLYVGYYNRAPDPVGLNFWIEAFDNGFTLDAMAEDFSTQAETLQNYPFFLNPDPSRADYGSFVDAVYQNLFNRDPDAEGKTFWVDKLDANEFSVGQVISLIIEGATTAPDSDVVANKVAVGRDFYIKTNAEPPYVFDDDDIQTATDIQASVTEDPATVTAAAAQTDAYIDSLGATTINLTENIDSPGGGGTSADTQGSSGDDTYSAVFDPDGGTLQNGDSIAAGGGEDTLDIRVTSSDAFTETSAATATGLEVINVSHTNGFDNEFTFNAAGIAGEKEISVSGGDNTTTYFENLDDLDLISMKDTSGILVVDIKGDRSASDDDSFNFYIEESGSEEKEAAFAFGKNENGGREDETFEIGNIETGGSTGSFLAMEGLALTDINVTGTQKLTLRDSGDRFEELKAVDASGMTGGGLALDANGGTEAAFAFLGSDFDDALTLNVDLLSASNSLSLDAGDGQDTLRISTFVDQVVSSINASSGFEILESINRSTSLSADDYNDIDTFLFSGQTANGGRLSIDKVTSDDLFIFTTDAGRTDEFLQFSADTVGQSLTFELRAEVEDDGQIELIADTSAQSFAAIGFSGNSTFNEVNIVSSGTNEDANLITARNDSYNAFAFDNEDGPTNFNISGDQALTITAEEGVALTSSAKESGFRDSVNLDGSEATGNLRIAGSNVNDAIAGGSGDDILYGMGGDDMLTGNDGSDQFRFSNWKGTDEIMDFVSGEDVVGLQRTDFGNTTATFEGAALSSEDYVENITSIANITNAEDEALIELQSGASQTQIEDTAISSAVEAYLLVFNETTEKGELWFDSDWSTGGTGSRQHVATFDDVNSLVELTGFDNTDFVEYMF